MIFQAVAYRVVPWLPLGLAFTFGLYGLFRKTVKVDSTTGTFLETLFLLPLTLAFLGWEMLRVRAPSARRTCRPMSSWSWPAS